MTLSSLGKSRLLQRVIFDNKTTHISGLHDTKEDRLD